MKKKCVIAVISIGIMACLAACGSESPSTSDITVNRDKKGPTSILTEGIDMDAEEKGDTKEADAEENEEAEAAGTKKGIVFGSSEAFGYQDFTYLTEELLSTSKTASRQEKTFSVYIPKEENPRVSGTSARSEAAGIYMKVNMEPYLQYKSDSYSMRANLDKYVTGEMEYYENYHDVIVGNIEETEDSAVCEVSYMEYDFYEDTYAPYYVVYGLYDLGDNVTALVTLSIDAENTTEETGKILEELSSFYQMDIHWDESFAQAKREKFEEKYEGNIYTVDCLTFKLPDGWEIDEDMSDDYDTFFAPDGDTEASGVCFAVSEVEEAFGVVDMFLEDMDEMQEIMEEDMADERDIVIISDLGITFLGRTITIEESIHDAEDEDAGNYVMYIAEDDNNLYMFFAFSEFEDEEESAGLSEAAQEAVEIFFETARVTNSFT